ncbi:Qat anti-phage system associated protein QatB [Corallococcus exercitus]|uniref:Qat anti-phage system associated protein QatB n=1 Tax=Corallococcus exercitus TaxID=2316736 RepID=UPI0035D40742
MQRGLGHYTSAGLGGSQRAAQRLAATARTAGVLYGIFDALRSGQTIQSELGFDAPSLAGLSAKEVGDRIINAIRPTDGTQDAEASRNALALAIADLLEQDPESDLTALTQEQIENVTERYIARDLCHRIELDIGKALLDKAATPLIGVQRLEEVRQYVQERLAACFRLRRERGERLTRSSATGLTGQVIRDTFEVFEGYIQ